MLVLFSFLLFGVIVPNFFSSPCTQSTRELPYERAHRCFQVKMYTTLVFLQSWVHLGTSRNTKKRRAGRIFVPFGFSWQLLGPIVAFFALRRLLMAILTLQRIPYPILGSISGSFFEYGGFFIHGIHNVRIFFRGGLRRQHKLVFHRTNEYFCVFQVSRRGKSVFSGNTYSD